MKPVKKVMLWSVGTMFLTFIHHVYGAFIYDEPFRLHVAIFAIPAIIVLLATYAGFHRAKRLSSGKVLFTIFLVVAIVCPFVAIGLYEGGYNHVVKNILYFAGVSKDILDQMYPSIYELPNDIIFELTGLSQFFTGVACGVAIYRSPHTLIGHLINSKLQENQ